MNDLFEYKDTIFKELRRRNSSRSNNPTRESSTKTTRSALSSGDNTKSRLESKLQKAVHNSKKQHATNEASSKSSMSKGDNIPAKSDKSDAVISSMYNNERPEPPSTPPPSTPKNSAPASLKRSTSPNKKKLNTYLKDSNGGNSSNASKNIVPSKPTKNDIIIDKDSNNSTNGSPSGSYTDLTQPKGLERKTSVEDMTSKYDSPTPPPESLKRIMTEEKDKVKMGRTTGITNRRE